MEPWCRRTGKSTLMEKCDCCQEVCSCFPMYPDNGDEPAGRMCEGCLRGMAASNADRGISDKELASLPRDQEVIELYILKSEAGKRGAAKNRDKTVKQARLS
eukprot:10437781-Heterocapsa_arctica.AAC.1